MDKDEDYVSLDKLWDFLSFKSLVTPNIIRIVYVIGIAVICYVVYIASTKSSSFGLLSMYLPNLGNPIVDIIINFIILNIFWRVACECYTVLFSINKHLYDLRAIKLHELNKKEN
jgi:cellobiose-specific phosphotransferase system component IIC